MIELKMSLRPPLVVLAMAISNYATANEAYLLKDLFVNVGSESYSAVFSANNCLYMFNANSSEVGKVTFKPVSKNCDGVKRPITDTSALVIDSSFISSPTHSTNTLPSNHRILIND